MTEQTTANTETPSVEAAPGAPATKRRFTKPLLAGVAAAVVLAAVFSARRPMPTRAAATVAAIWAGRWAAS